MMVAGKGNRLQPGMFRSVPPGSCTAASHAGTDSRLAAGMFMSVPERNCKAPPRNTWSVFGEPNVDLEQYLMSPFQDSLAALQDKECAANDLYLALKDLVMQVQADLLAKYSVEPTKRGVAELSTAYKMDPDSCYAGRLAELIWRAKVEQVVAMQEELLTCFSSPGFQVELNQIHRSHHPCSASFGERFANLLAPVYAQVLPSYGFTGDMYGLNSMTVTTAELMCEPEVQTITAAIDGALYGAMAPLAQVQAAKPRPMAHAGMPTLGKQQVLQLLREQLTAFSDENFQANRIATLGAMKSNSPGLAVSRSQLALTAQQLLLPKFGLEANFRGVHRMLHICAQHILDPEVARLAYGIHALLGMDRPEEVVDRLRDIQTEVSFLLPEAEELCFN